MDAVGVNVGGVNLKMADVAAAFHSAGFGERAHDLASGNVLFSAPGDAKAVRSASQTALRRQFATTPGFSCMTSATVRDVVGDPVRARGRRQAFYVTFVSDPAVLDELAALAPGPDEGRRRGDGFSLAGAGNRRRWPPPSARPWASSGAESSTTTRNLRTLDKVLQ